MFFSYSQYKILILQVHCLYISKIYDFFSCLLHELIFAPWGAISPQKNASSKVESYSHLPPAFKPAREVGTLSLLYRFVNWLTCPASDRAGTQASEWVGEGVLN